MVEDLDDVPVDGVAEDLVDPALGCVEVVVALPDERDTRRPELGFAFHDAQHHGLVRAWSAGAFGAEFGEPLEAPAQFLGQVVQMRPGLAAPRRVGLDVREMVGGRNGVPRRIRVAPQWFRGAHVNTPARC